MKKPAMAALAVLALAAIATTGCRSTTKSGAPRPAPSTSSVPSTTPTVPPTSVTTAPPATATPLVPAKAGAGCRSGDPLANVYHEDRLTVIKPCMTVSGTVTGVRPEDDGDSHVYLALDASYASSLKLTSLLLEIVPADKPSGASRL